MARNAQRGSFRIIGGEWRRRRLDFVTDLEVRPSPDRVRETLFNWLAPVIEGARCLDLYAGSGALGLEALSRGAASVTFVDREPRVIAKITEHLELLGGRERATLLITDAQRYLADAQGQFDVVFVDPPFRDGLIEPALQALRHVLSPGHRVYVESETPPPALPAGWDKLKSARAGQVSFALVRLGTSPHNPADSAADSP